MAKVLITEGHLADIADAIRAKLESEDTYTPGEMAGAIMEIETGIIPTGTKQIAANGTHDVTQYASAAVQVPNTYVAADEGKVVSNGALVAQTGTTITQNGTYDTTENDEVTVNVSGGGYPEPTGSVSITENGTYDVKDVASAVVAVPTSEPVLQSKTAVRNGTVTPDAGYDGLSSVVVNVPSTGPIAPIIRCGMAKGSMTQTLDLSSVNAEKLIVVAMNGDTDDKTLGTRVETLSSTLTGTTLDYHQYSATGDNRMNYRIDAYDLSASVSDLEISLTDGWVDEHTAFAWALIGAGDFVIGKVMTTLEAATTGSNDRSGSVLFGTMNGSGAGISGGAAHSDSYHRGDTVATDDPGSGYMGSYIIWFVESGGGGGYGIPMSVTANSIYQSSPKQPWQAFGDIPGNFWGSGGRSGNYIQMLFGTPVAVAKIKFSNYYRINTSTYWYSSNVAIRASNDNFATYTELYSGTGIAQSETQIEVSLQNTTEYLAYRLVCSDSTAYVGLGRIELIT